MKLLFSPLNSITEFDSIHTENQVYLGFASKLQTNLFSQKHQASPYNSTTETLIHNLDFLQLKDKEDATLLLHQVQGIVSLDVATAAFAITQDFKELQGKSWNYLSVYIGEIEQGFTRPPFLNSLYAFYYATALSAQKRFSQDSQEEQCNQYVVETYHKGLEALFNSGGFKDFNAPHRFMELLPQSFSVALQEEEIKNEKNRYFSQDYERAEHFELDLPLKQSHPPKYYNKVCLLALSDPQSSLLKFFARNPMVYPKKQETQVFPCTYVHHSNRRGFAHEHIISVPPTLDTHLKGLSELLEEMEDCARLRDRKPKRPQDRPRPGYKYNDPWYDERHANYSILDTPSEGSYLDRIDIMEALWYYATPLKTIYSKHVTISIFIPFWLLESSFETIKSDERWTPFRYDDQGLQNFLPYVQDIFRETQNHENSARLHALEFQGAVHVKLDPQHVLDEGSAVEVIRKKTLARTESILATSQLKLRFFLYEYGLGFLELYIEPQAQDCSIVDTQWLEHCITLTPLQLLLGHIINTEEFKKESPDKHFACTTLSHFDYAGGHLRDGRSTGGGIQMMVSDVEPIYKNLPLNTKLETQQTLIDETSKRYYYSSSTSMLNFDDFASHEEHQLAHVTASIIFNMVLAQRFILSKSRHDIVLAEFSYNQRRNALRFNQWIWGIFSFSSKEEILSISSLREDIQHMTISSWFNLVSNSESAQRIFEKLREQMKIECAYQEVQERSADLDAFIANKQAEVQSRVFNIFTFIMSPLNLVFGFMGGYQFFNFKVKEENPIPFLSFGIESGWVVFTIYLLFWGFISLGIWVNYKWKSIKE